MAHVKLASKQYLDSDRRPTPAGLARQIRQMLKDGGSAEHAQGVQWFFKEEIKSHGWYTTAALRKAAVRSRREIHEAYGLGLALQVAHCLFSGTILEEKIFAVFSPGTSDHPLRRCRIQAV